MPESGAVDGALMMLRARARTRAAADKSTSHKADLELGGVKFAWRVTWRRTDERIPQLQELEDFLVIGLRKKPGEAALLRCLTALPEDLVCYDRQDNAAGVLFRLRYQRGCVRCGHPVDGAAKLKGSTRCTGCMGGTTLCRRCRKQVPDEPNAAWVLCDTCTVTWGSDDAVPCIKGCGRMASTAKGSMVGVCPACSEIARREMGWKPRPEVEPTIAPLNRREEG